MKFSVLSRVFCIEKASVNVVIKYVMILLTVDELIDLICLIFCDGLIWIIFVKKKRTSSLNNFQKLFKSFNTVLISFIGFYYYKSLFFYIDINRHLLGK